MNRILFYKKYFNQFENPSRVLNYNEIYYTKLLYRQLKIRCATHRHVMVKLHFI